MKKVKKRKAVKRIVLIIFIVLVIGVGIAVYAFYPMLMMSPAQTGGIPGTNINAARNGGAPVYFVDTGNGYIMIDAGSGQNALESNMRDMGIISSDVKWVLLTHSDGDHVASLPLFPNAAIHISESEIPLLNGMVSRGGNRYNSLPDGADVGGLIPLHDGQELLFADTAVKCIAAPGHTNGSMLFLVDGQYLFTGDVFSVINNRVGVHPFTMDEETAKKTIGSLKDTISGSALVLTTHYGYFDEAQLSFADN